MDFPERINLIVKPNQRKTEITKQEGSTYYLNVKAEPEKGKANLEIIKFFSKLTKKEVKIVSGLTSKKKVLKLQ